MNNYTTLNIVVCNHSSMYFCITYLCSVLLCSVLLTCVLNTNMFIPWVSGARTKTKCYMMTSSNGNIFRDAGPLRVEFTGHRWIPAHRPMTRSFEVFFYLCLNKPLGKQSRDWWFETPSLSLWRHCNDSILWDVIIFTFPEYPLLPLIFLYDWDF